MLKPRSAAYSLIPHPGEAVAGRARDRRDLQSLRSCTQSPCFQYGLPREYVRRRVADPYESATRRIEERLAVA